MAKIPNINCIYYKNYRCIYNGYQDGCIELADKKCANLKEHYRPPAPPPPPKKK